MSPVVYLLEFFNPSTSELVNADVFSTPNAALAEAIEFAKRLPASKPLMAVDVEKEIGGELKGAAFFCEGQVLVACLTRYDLSFVPEEERLAQLNVLPALQEMTSDEIVAALVKHITD